MAPSVFYLMATLESNCLCDCSKRDLATQISALCFSPFLKMRNPGSSVETGSVNGPFRLGRF